MTEKKPANSRLKSRTKHKCEDLEYVDLEIIFHKMRQKLLIVEAACYSLHEINYSNHDVYSSQAVAYLAGEALDDLSTIQSHLL